MSFIWNVVSGLITMQNCDIIVYPGSPWYYFMWLQCLVVIIQLHFIDILYNIHGQMTICVWLYGVVIIFHYGFVDLIHYKRSRTRTFSSGWTTFRWPFQGRTKPWNTGVTQWSVFVSEAGFKCSTDIASSNSAWCITNFFGHVVFSTFSNKIF